MKIKVSEATNIQLDWLVAKLVWSDREVKLVQWSSCTRIEVPVAPGSESMFVYAPTIDWLQGGSIIDSLIDDLWNISKADFNLGIKIYCIKDGLMQMHRGPNTLIASMRCYVSSKFGDEVEVPKELL